MRRDRSLDSMSATAPGPTQYPPPPRPDSRRVRIAVVVVALVLVALAGLAIGPFLGPRPAVGTGCSAWACNVVMSGPVSATAGAHHWYNFTVLKVNQTLSPEDMLFVARNPVGDILSPFPWTVVFVHAGSTTPFAAYNASSSTWTYGTTVSLGRGDVLSADVGTGDVAGYALVALGQGALSGALSLPLG